MGVWHFRCSCRNLTSALIVAGKTRIGIEIRLSLSEPFQTGRAAAISPPSAGDAAQVWRVNLAERHGGQNSLRVPEVGPSRVERSHHREPLRALAEHVA